MRYADTMMHHPFQEMHLKLAVLARGGLGCEGQDRCVKGYRLKGTLVAQNVFLQSSASVLGAQAVSTWSGVVRSIYTARRV